MTVGQIILEQLGGHKFVIMTGSKNFLTTQKGLMFSLAQNKSGANRLLIELDKVSDTYVMTFSKLRGYTVKVVAKHSDVYAEDLRRFFTEETGFYTSLAG